jgi:hypothetical protein
MGFISFLYVSGRFYQFSSYNGSKLERVERDGDRLHIRMTGNGYGLQIEATVNRSGYLMAPVNGLMERPIKESIDSSASFILTDAQTRVIREGYSGRAGMEVIERIFNYL